MKNEEADPPSRLDPERARFEARLNSQHFFGHPDYGKGSLSPWGERIFASSILAVFVALTVITIRAKF